VAHQLFARTGSQISVKAPLVLEEAALLFALMLVPFVAICVATGMTWSLKAKGVLGAVIPSVAIIGVLAVILGACGMSTVTNVPLIGPVINALSPTTNVFMVVNPYGSGGFWGGVTGFNAAGGQVFGRMQLAIAAAAAAGTYSLIVYAMVLGMIKTFDHTVRKLSGTG